MFAEISDFTSLWGDNYVLSLIKICSHWQTQVTVNATQMAETKYGIVGVVHLVLWLLLVEGQELMGAAPTLTCAGPFPRIPSVFRVTWELHLGSYSESATPMWQHKTWVVLHQQTSKKSFYLIVKDALRRRKWVFCWLVAQIEYHMQNRLLYNNKYLRRVWVIETRCHGAKQGWEWLKKHPAKEAGTHLYCILCFQSSFLYWIPYV